MPKPGQEQDSNMSRKKTAGKTQGDGLGLAIRFSYMPNYLGYCGPECANTDFLGFLGRGRKRKKHSAKRRTAGRTSARRKIISDIRKFEGLYPYLSAIAKKSGRHFTDYSVIEAYWIGNGLLGKFTRKDMQKLVLSLAKSGLPLAYARKLADEMPGGFIPHHNFNVFYVGVGQITGSVRTNLKNMNSCMIAKAVVKKITKSSLVVSRKPLVMHGRKLAFGKAKNYTIKFDEKRKQMLRKIGQGDTVAMHWGSVAMKLSKAQAGSLEKCTQAIIKTLNANKRR